MKGPRQSEKTKTNLLSASIHHGHSIHKHGAIDPLFRFGLGRARATVVRPLAKGKAWKSRQSMAHRRFLAGGRPPGAIEHIPQTTLQSITVEAAKTAQRSPVRVRSRAEIPGGFILRQAGLDVGGGIDPPRIEIDQQAHQQVAPKALAVEDKPPAPLQPVGRVDRLLHHVPQFRGSSPSRERGNVRETVADRFKCSCRGQHRLKFKCPYRTFRAEVLPGLVRRQGSPENVLILSKTARNQHAPLGVPEPAPPGPRTDVRSFDTGDCNPDIARSSGRGGVLAGLMENPACPDWHLSDTS